jgi:hypothetical protein
MAATPLIACRRETGVWRSFNWEKSAMAAAYHFPWNRHEASCLWAERPRTPCHRLSAEIVRAALCVRPPPWRHFPSDERNRGLYKLGLAAEPLAPLASAVLGRKNPPAAALRLDGHVHLVGDGSASCGSGSSTAATIRFLPEGSAPGWVDASAGPIGGTLAGWRIRSDAMCTSRQNSALPRRPSPGSMP